MNLVRRLVRILGQVSLIALLGLLLAEGLLQVAALFGRDREHVGAAVAGAREILCVGDSHTYGAMVPPDQSYPAHLQRLLDARAPGTYAVLNLGVPGYNTALTRERLRGALARHHPEVVIIWCGVNNNWNRSGPDDVRVPWTARLDAWTSQHVRLLRLARTWLHDRQLDTQLAQLGGQAPKLVAERDRDGTVKSVTIGGQGAAEQTRYVRGAALSDRALEEGLVADYRGMVDDARRAGARVVLVAYPLGIGLFETPNRALRRVALTSGVPLVEANTAFERVAPEQRGLLPGAHPNGVVYGEVARDVLAAVLPRPGAPAVEPGVIASLDFASAPPTSDETPATAPAVHGPCPYSTPACDGDRACYRWRPEGGQCSVESRFSMLTTVVDVSARLRLGEVESDVPSRRAPFQIIGVVEEHFGTGVFVDVEGDGRVRVTTFGGREGSCGPLDPQLERGRWYTVRLHAEKSEEATVALELADAGGTVLDRARCARLPTGRGYFKQIRVGSGAPSTLAAVDFSEVEVRTAPEPAA